MTESGRSPELPQVSCSLAVFAPSPAVTITVEPSPGDEPDIHLHAGGQGFWVARMAARLGARVSLCVPLGGETGTVLESLLAADGISVLSVDTEGANGAYVHDRRGGEREVIAETSSPSLARHELDDLYGVTLAAALDSDALLVTGPRNEGVLPSDVFERLCRDLRSNGRLVLADLSGEPLTAALRGGLDFLKVSDEDLVDDRRLDDRRLPAAVGAADQLHAEGAANVLVSRSAKAALLLGDKRLFEVHSPRFAPVDEHGAGDSLFAGIGVALGAGLPIEAAVRLGVAAGALNVARHGLGTGHMREVSRLAEEVRVDPLGRDQLGAGGETSAASTAS
jgi:1-phosphofructokinase